MSESVRRVGFVGAGFIAEYHARALKHVRGARFVAVCDVNAARREALAKTFGIDQTYQSVEQMLRTPRVQAVHLLVPPEHHLHVARTILGHGLPLLTEKPMAISRDECRELNDLARRQRVPLGVNHNFLFSPVYERLRADVQAGKIGRIDQITITWCRELPQVHSGPFDAFMFRDPTAILFEVGPHPISQMLDLVGLPDDLLAVLPSRPIELPGGQRFYRRWHISMRKGDTTVDLRLFFDSGLDEQSVAVWGSFGKATADIERNTYSIELRSPYSVDLDRYAMTASVGSSLRRQARQNLLRYAASKFNCSRRGNAFEVSIAGAQRAFYRGLSNGRSIDGRITSDFGCLVIEQAERIAAAADVGERKCPVFKSRPPVRAPRILVIGGSGFIGGELVSQLCGRGDTVRVMSRRPEGTALGCRFPEAEVVGGNILQENDLDRALNGIEIVFHLARAVGKTWEEYHSLDVLGTRLIGKRCLVHGIRRLIYTGSIDSYYAGAASDTITENTPLDRKIHSRNHYARAKAMGERLLMQMHREDGLPVVIVRPGIVLGRGGSPLHWGVGMWNGAGLVQVWGDGRNPMPFVLVQDVADGLIRAMETSAIEGGQFNLVGEPLLTAREYLENVEKHARVRLQKLYTPIYKHYLSEVAKAAIKIVVRHNGVKWPSYHDWKSRTQRARFDSTKAKQVLGWTPEADRDKLIALGIREPVEQFLT